MPVCIVNLFHLHCRNLIAASESGNVKKSEITVFPLFRCNNMRDLSKFFGKFLVIFSLFLKWLQSCFEGKFANLWFLFEQKVDLFNYTLNYKTLPSNYFSNWEYSALFQPLQRQGKNQKVDYFRPKILKNCDKCDFLWPTQRNSFVYCCSVPGIIE